MQHIKFENSIFEVTNRAVLFLQLNKKSFVWQIVKEKIWRIKCASDKFKVFFTDCNQIYLVMFMCLTVDTRFIFTKNQDIAKCLLDVCNTEMQQRRWKSWNLDIQRQTSMSKSVQTFLIFFIEEYQSRSTCFQSTFFW